MPEAEIFKGANKMKNYSCFNDGIRLKYQNNIENVNEAFLIEFNEDGSPIDCHSVRKS